MTNKYFQISTKTELFDNPSVPVHLQYGSKNPDHVAIDESTPFFSPLPAGQQLTLDINGIPNGLEPIPAPVYTAEEAIATRYEAIYSPIETDHGLADTGRGKDGVLGIDNVKDAVAAYSAGLDSAVSVNWIMTDNSVAQLTIEDLNKIIVDFNLRKQTVFDVYSKWRAGDKLAPFVVWNNYEPDGLNE